VLEHDLGDERPRLQVASPLALEEVALGAYDRALPQQLKKIRHVILQARLILGKANSRAACDQAEQRAVLRRMPTAAQPGLARSALCA